MMREKKFALNLYNMAKKELERKTIEIDAKGKAPGRIATQVAMILQGKHKASYQAYLDMGDFVVVNNAKQLKFTGRKLEQRDYYHHTMYPGGIKRTPMKKVFLNDPREIVRRAVHRMLPKNKLRDDMMKRLTINV